MGIETGFPSDNNDVIDLRAALEERYLSYALSTIMHRALPDVRDGLKPVHRRILYAMRQLRLEPQLPFKKSARVVGDVIGKYHPHGDQAVYDALVRLAQDFAVRYPLVDGQGNFGNIDGDNAAAMRYTESRMTAVAIRLLDGIDEDAVDFRDTYDGSESEPVVLPADFPNLLANGATGIAVGMATSIPPHNAAELCEASRLLVADRDTPLEKLLECVPGPDLPTGGVLVESRSSIAESYATGRGSFRVRAKWDKEDLDRGMWQIVITEIPYQVQKSRLIEKIADLLFARKLPLLGDIRDESAEDIRIVIEPKTRTVDPALLMESLFRLTDLESRLSLNMNVLSKGIVPRVLGLREVLLEWLDHRKEVLVRRSRFRLAKIEDRLEVLEGYLIAYLNLDEVIRIIREEDDAKASLIAAFELTDKQAEAILNMRLRALRKLEEFEIRKERDGLIQERDDLVSLLDSDKKQWKRIDAGLKDLIKAFGPDTELGRRRTAFGKAPSHDAVDIHQAMIEREPITIILSEKGWIRALKGHLSDVSSLSFKQGDTLKAFTTAYTTDKIMILATHGRVYTLGADKLPGGRGQGDPLRILVDLEEGEDVVSMFVYKGGRKLLISSKEGRGFVVPEDELVANTRKGKQILNVGGQDKAAFILPIHGDWLATVGNNRKMLVFPVSQIAEMSRGKGVRLQRYKDGGISDARSFDAAKGLVWMDTAGRSYTRTLDDLLEWQGDRAQAGRLAPQGFPRSNLFGNDPFADILLKKDSET
jgi:topoisomerase-4 subunit A